MNSGFGDDVCVETIAEVDRVDVVTVTNLACVQQDAGDNMSHALRSTQMQAPKLNSPFQITVHNREEHLEEQVDGVYQHRQQVQPCFASHCEGSVCSVARMS